MIDLTKAILPSAIKVDGIYYAINTDYQYWIRFNNMLKAKVSDPMAFDFMYRDLVVNSDTQIMEKKVPADRMAGIMELLKFNTPARALPRDTGHGSPNRMLDFEIDADLIYSAFYDCYGLDILNENLHLHWYKFTVLLDGLHDTKLNEVMSFRGYVPNDTTKYETYMRRMQQAWELEEVLSPKEQKALDEFDALLK